MSRLSPRWARRASGRGRQAEELNDRAHPERATARVHSLAMLLFILQWSAIYFFNTVQKDGQGWKDGQPATGDECEQAHQDEREEGGVDALARAGVRLHPLFRAQDVVEA